MQHIHTMCKIKTYKDKK